MTGNKKKVYARKEDIETQGEKAFPYSTLVYSWMKNNEILQSLVHPV